MKRFVLKLLSQFYVLLKRSYIYLTYDAFRAKYNIDKSFRFNGENINFYGDGQIYIGSNSYIGSYSTIESSNGCMVKIGNNCSISHNVRMYTTSNEAQQNFNTIGKRKKKEGNINIGNGVWIGVNVIINPGITIGDNVVIGANSVVTKNVESNSIVGGVPAKFIKKIEIGA